MDDAQNVLSGLSCNLMQILCETIIINGEPARMVNNFSSNRVLLGVAGVVELVGFH